MAADHEKFVAFLPVSKIIPIDPLSLKKVEEEKKPDRKRSGTSQANQKGGKKVMAASGNPDDDGTPNSFNRKDLALRLQDLRDDQIYYLVYMRNKTQSEINAD